MHVEAVEGEQAAGGGECGDAGELAEVKDSTCSGFFDAVHVLVVFQRRRRGLDAARGGWLADRGRERIRAARAALSPDQVDQVRRLGRYGRGRRAWWRI